MTIYFMGGEIGGFLPADSNAYEYAYQFNSSFARCALRATNLSYLDTPALGTLTDFYTHLEGQSGQYIGTTRDNWQLLDGSGVPRIRMQWEYSTQQMVFGYYASSSWAELGRVTLTGTTLQTYDIRTKCNTASGIFKVYVAGTERLSVTPDFSALTSIGKFRIAGDDYGLITSQVVLADEPTIGWRLLTRYPSGAGATSSWTGSYTDIDEGLYSDADFILSATANQVSTFAQTGPAITGYTVRAVAVTARARCGAAGPQNIQMALRVSGTDYFSANKALDVGYRAFCNVWETNPVTGVAWLNTAIDALQPGVKSIA